MRRTGTIKSFINQSKDLKINPLGNGSSVRDVKIAVICALFLASAHELLSFEATVSEQYFRHNNLATQ